MYYALKKSVVCLAAVAVLFLLLVPPVMARDDGGNIVGMDVRANYNGGLVGKVEDVRGSDVVIDLKEGSDVIVPRSSLSVNRENGYVLFEGSKNALYNMYDSQRGYYRDRDRDRDRYRDDYYRDRDRERGYYRDRDRFRDYSRDDYYRDRDQYRDYPRDDYYRDGDRYRDDYREREEGGLGGLIDEFLN
ncbi:MAG: hypothetical protein C4576_25475 [Desulfobacteraceae bacterium]|nr:MAG: hypothetical protein C4576_25475 [Desulfobacteraceae bacterium]